MRYSILIPFRNKPLATVQNCLEALALQDIKGDFEVIFIDYGSDASLTQQLQTLVGQYPFCYYFYNETRGFFWNQPHALNSGLKQAKGQYLIRLDVDMILSPRFLSALSHQIQTTCFYHTTCFALNQTTSLPIRSLDSYLLSRQYQIRKACGVFLAVEREVLFDMGGFDEFYYFWGVDDLDTSQRLQQKGLKEIWLDTKENPVFHQWHPHAAIHSPTNWYPRMWQYYQKNQQEPNRNLDGFGKIYTLTDRPALQKILSESFDTNFTFSFPKEASFSTFFKLFLSLKKANSLQIRQDFNSIQFNPHAKLGKWMNLWNRIFEKIGFSYRWTDIKTYETAWITPQHIKDFLFYFVIEFKEEITDYYLDQQGTEITFVLVKK